MLQVEEGNMVRPGSAGGASRWSARWSLVRVGQLRSRRLPVTAVALVVLVLVTVMSSVTPARADGITWTERTAPASEWWSVAYGDGLWVAVAQAGADRVMTSTDGIVWTERTSPTAKWMSVAYGDGLWVAVGDDDFGVVHVMTSTDGITWTPRTAPSNWWRSVAYENGLWVAVARTGVDRVMTSTDGITWTPRTAPSASWRSVAYGNGLWVAVSASFDADDVMTSTDGFSWTSRTPALIADWYGVAYGTDGDGQGLWVAVGSDYVPGGAAVMTSPNGIVWTARTPDPDTGREWLAVAYGDGLWVAVAYEGNVMTSGELVIPVPKPVQLGPRVMVACAPVPPSVGATIACTITGGDPGIDVLWRAAAGSVFAGAGVTLDAAGSGQFSFVVPAAALGQELTVELVEWLTPLSLGVVGVPVPGSVPAGEGLVPVWPIVLAALAGVVLMRRGMLVKG
jgi:hypothetical protein